MTQVDSPTACEQRRREVRLAISLEVQVWGSGADGSKFSQVAVARNISRSGALLCGLERPLRMGDLLWVQSGNARARFRVVWSRHSGAVELHRAAVHRLDPDPCPWLPLLPAADVRT